MGIISELEFLNVLNTDKAKNYFLFNTNDDKDKSDINVKKSLISVIIINLMMIFYKLYSNSKIITYSDDIIYQHTIPNSFLNYSDKVAKIKDYIDFIILLQKYDTVKMSNNYVEINTLIYNKNKVFIYIFINILNRMLHHINKNDDKSFNLYLNSFYTNFSSKILFLIEILNYDGEIEKIMKNPYHEVKGVKKGGENNNYYDNDSD